MDFLKNIFSKKEGKIETKQDFWNWFIKYEKDFFHIVKERTNLQKGFFDKLSPKLDEIKSGFYYVTGMYDDNTVELILTADGDIKNIAFVEELVNAAPAISGWRITALKPSLDVKDVNIKMAGYEFNGKNIHFYSNEIEGYPDEIDVTIVHDDYTLENKDTIINGTYIFIDNFIGELNSVTTIDNLTFIGTKEATKDLIPIEKLKDYLIWREKEFIEKYQGIRYNTDEDNYSIIESELESGGITLAVINTDLLGWDSKASHPWILKVEIKFDGSKNNGMPDEETYKLLDKIEEDIMEELKDVEGYLNFGRETSGGLREIYFTCRDFRKPSKVLAEIEQNYTQYLKLSFQIFKDKYWQTFNRFEIMPE
jgi:Family of unknown function (DUF695)